MERFTVIEDNNNPIVLDNGERWLEMPHGSGIDCNWNYYEDETGNKIVLSNEYHAMDQNGVYCGYVRFEVFIDKQTGEMDVSVNNEDIDAIIEEYEVGEDGETNAPYLGDLADYLYDTINSYNYSAA